MFISYLMVPKHEPIINNLEELAHSENQCLILERGTAIGQMILVNY